MSSDSHASHKDLAADGGAHHVSPLWLYWGVFGALIVMTVVTVGASYVDFGSANMIIAVAIASVKAFLVAFFFMHLKDDKPFNALVFLAGIFFLGTLFVFTLADQETRNQVDPVHGEIIPTKK